MIIDMSKEVKDAISEAKPIVALETAVFTHGLKYPTNLKSYNEMKNAVISNGAIPAFIGIINGKVKVGMNDEEIEDFCKNGSSYKKAGYREIPYLLANNLKGGTTVSATTYIASFVGIRVMATGGIGGVHREKVDISQDIDTLSRIRMVVVCSGFKSILDVDKTLEYLEYRDVMLTAYKTDELPVFYYNDSGYKVEKVQSPKEIASVYRNMVKLAYESSIVVANPSPQTIDKEELENYMNKIEEEIIEKKVTGKGVTPYLLGRLGELSEGKTIEVNLALLRNNAALGAQIAKELL
jgi:pseudouridine-5'-phosphate glycosidase